MAEKDIAEKVLLRQADVFADCENVLAYGGRRRIRAEALQPAPTESFYQSGEGLHSQFCDVSFYLVEDGRVRARYIIGNETRLRRRQVLRKAAYEGGAYREQLESDKPVYPVISMVMDWTRKRTRIPLSIHELLAEGGAAGEDIGLAEDVRLSVHHMRNIPKAVRDLFTSDMGFVADYLNEGSFENRREQKIVHGEALCRMMEALTGDGRFTDQIGELMRRQRERGEIVMCEYIDMLEARGEAQGVVKGENRLASLLTSLYSLGRDEDAKLAVRDEGVRRRLYEELKVFLPLPEA